MGLGMGKVYGTICGYYTQVSGKELAVKILLLQLLICSIIICEMFEKLLENYNGKKA